jgi:predicted DsbA family dithiol-disulfide isomerase
LGGQIAIEWKSFMLRPAPEKRQREKFVTYTESWLRPAALEPQATFRVWASESNPPSHSLPALVAGKLAEQHGPDAAEAYHRALLVAYFSDNRTISDVDVQVDLASGIGLDGAEFATQLAEQRSGLAALVVDDHNQAIEIGITAVPTVVMGGALAVPGAQDVETYERLVLRLIERVDQAGVGFSSDPGSR